MTDAARLQQQTIVAPIRLTDGRLIFPILINFWPIVLIASQKLLVPVGLVTLDYGRNGARNDLLVVLGMLIIGTISLVTLPTEYAVGHFVGYALFLLAIPPFNLAIRQARVPLIKWLSILSIFNSAMALIIYFLAIDLSSFRGLNRIIDSNGDSTRVYFETTSLLAVFSVNFIRQIWLRYICIAIVSFYALFLGKSVFVVLLFFANRYAASFFRGRLRDQLLIVLGILMVAVIGPLIVAALRPDFALSLGIKLLQFARIINDPTPLWTGGGWGYVIDKIAGSPDQPYQIEMQLPMLMVQIGLIQLVIFAACMLLLFSWISHDRRALLARFLTYFAIGFSNPWMFIPSWYLTVALMYSNLDKKEA